MTDGADAGAFCGLPLWLISNEVPMRIAFKLVLGFVVLSLIAAGLGLWTDMTNRAVQAEVDSLAHNSIVDFADATEMQMALMASHTAAAELLEARRGTIPPDTDAYIA